MVRTFCFFSKGLKCFHMATTQNVLAKMLIPLILPIRYIYICFKMGLLVPVIALSKSFKLLYFYCETVLMCFL